MIIIYSTDLNYLLKEQSDISRYNDFLDFEMNHIRKIFDPIYNRLNTKNCFVKSNTTTEFFLNTSIKNPLLTLPIDEQLAAWSKFKPVTILYFDSAEIPKNLYQYQLKFIQEIPSYCTIAIDAKLLILKFIKYVEESESKQPDVEINNYLKEHVFYPMHDDLINIHLQNVIMNRIMYKETNYEQIISGSLSNWLRDLDLLIDNLKANKIGIGDFLNTKLLFNKSYFEYIHELDNINALPDIRQYLYLDLIKELPVLKMLLLLDSFNPTKSYTQRINLNVRRRLDILDRTREVYNVKDSFTRTHILDELSEIRELTK